MPSLRQETLSVPEIPSESREARLTLHVVDRNHTVCDDERSRPYLSQRLVTGFAGPYGSYGELEPDLAYTSRAAACRAFKALFNPEPRGVTGRFFELRLRDVPFVDARASNFTPLLLAGQLRHSGGIGLMRAVLNESGYDYVIVNHELLAPYAVSLTRWTKQFSARRPHDSVDRSLRQARGRKSTRFKAVHGSAAHEGSSGVGESAFASGASGQALSVEDDGLVDGTWSDSTQTGPATV
jgi:hypothetical protein